MVQMQQKIEEILKDDIIPVLANHGGSIQVESLDETEQVAILQMTGACASCMFSDDTIENFVKTVFEEKMPGLTVEVNTGPSEEILELARQYLKKETE